jgi:hypothetical protein
VAVFDVTDEQHAAALDPTNGINAPVLRRRRGDVGCSATGHRVWFVGCGSSGVQIVEVMQ